VAQTLHESQTETGDERPPPGASARLAGAYGENPKSWGLTVSAILTDNRGKPRG